MEQYFDLIDTFNSLSGVRYDGLDRKARRHFTALASHLLDNINDREEEILSAKENTPLWQLLNHLSFNQYADFFRIWTDFHGARGYDYWKSLSLMARKIDYLIEQSFDILKPIEEELMGRFRAWIHTPYWNEGIFKETQIALNRINLTSKDPEEDKRKLRQENHDALSRNLFGHQWLSEVLSSVVDADRALDDREFSDFTVCSIIGSTIENRPRTTQPFMEIPNPHKWGEKFDYDEELYEFCQLRAAYLLLTGQESHYFDRYDVDDPDDQPAPASSPAAPAAEENQQPTVPAEERKRRLDLYVALAHTMGLPDDVLQDIRKVFDPRNNTLWGKIAKDKQKAIPYTDYDHTDLTPFFNLLGVLKRRGPLPKGKEWIALLDKLPNDFHSKNKEAIKTAVTNGSRKKPKPLAGSIEHRLDQQ